MLEPTEFNRQAVAWAAATEAISRSAAAAFTKGKRKNRTYKSGPKAGTVERRIKSDLTHRLWSDAGELSGISFRFPVHGIFREYGVGRGATRATASHTLRSPSDWFTHALDSKEGELADLVADYKGGQYLRILTGIYK